MKNFSKIIVAVFLLFQCLTFSNVFAKADTITPTSEIQTKDGLIYEYQEATKDFILLGFEKTATTKNLTIPDRLEKELGQETFPVTEIAKGAFKNKGLTSVTFSGNLQTIGESAFEGNDLKTITIPNSVTQIGKYAFSSNILETVKFKARTNNLSGLNDVFTNQKRRDLEFNNWYTNSSLWNYEVVAGTTDTSYIANWYLPLKLNDFTDNMTILSGTTSPGATVTVSILNQTNKTGYADTQGDFSINIGNQKAQTNLTVEASILQYEKKQLNYIVLDKTAPTLTLSPITQLTTAIQGQTEANAAVELFINDKYVNKMTANSLGNFNFSIVAQPIGTLIKFVLTDSSGNQSVKYEVVKEAKQTTLLTLVDVNNQSTTVQGKAPAKANILLYINNRLQSITIVDNNENYVFYISKQSVGTLIKVVSKVEGLLDQSKETTVKTKVMPKLIVQPIDDQSTTISGQTENNAKVEIFKNNILQQIIYADSKGNFSFVIAKQSIGTVFKLVTTDSNLDSTTVTSVVQKKVVLLIVEEVTEQTTTIFGKTEAYATVTLSINNQLIRTMVADVNGNFNFTINKQLKDTRIKIVARDNYNNETIKDFLVVDRLAPELTVQPIYNVSSSIKGTTEPNSQIEILKNNQLIASGKADAKGQFSIKVGLQRIGEVVVVTAQDSSKNKTMKSVIVQYKNSVQVTLNKVGKDDITVIGKAEAAASVKLYINNILQQTVAADLLGNFRFNITPKKVGTYIKVVATDSDDNTSVEQVVVYDSGVSNIQLNRITNLDTEIKGQATALTTVYLYINSIFKEKAEVNQWGEYAIKTAKLKAGTTVEVRTEVNGQYKTAITKVIDLVAPTRPKVNKIKSKSTRVKGTAERNSTIKIYRGSRFLASGKTSTTGNFSVKIVKQRKGIELTITATDRAGNQSKERYITVGK